MAQTNAQTNRSEAPGKYEEAEDRSEGVTPRPSAVSPEPKGQSPEPNDTENLKRKFQNQYMAKTTSDSSSLRGSPPTFSGQTRRTEERHEARGDAPADQTPGITRQPHLRRGQAVVEHFS